VVATSFGDVLDLTNKYNPIAITLDVKLPDASGWRILDLFKNDINFKHIPVHLISGEENRLLAMQRGAKSFNLKPLKAEVLTILFQDIIDHNERKQKRVLVVEDNELDSSQIAKILDNGDLLNIEVESSGMKALDLIRNNSYDCIIVDYMLPDIGGLEFVTEINTINKQQLTPIIIYSAKDFSPSERLNLSNTLTRFC
jgi:DNA-binding response OmpR family regulator